MKYGFRMVGGKKAVRRLVDRDKAFAAYAACNPNAEVNCEAYLSAFIFPVEFKTYLEGTGSTRGYSGPCDADYIWWDVDRTDLELALADARRLAIAILAYGEPLCFFSGSKGFHFGLATALWSPATSLIFNGVARRFAGGVAEQAGVKIDTTVYDKVRAFRASNSRHPASGLYKVRLSQNELESLSLGEIKALASQPRPFDVPQFTTHSELAAAAWQAATQWVDNQAQATAIRTNAHLNRLTLDFLREGAKAGERATRLFSAAANLAEFGCPPDLAHALLSEPALDCGLSPSETRREIDCGLNHRSTHEKV